MIELFVEKNVVDVNVGFATLLTMAIDDIKDFGAKNTTFSKTIILPGTLRNNKLFGNIFEVSAGNNYDPSQSNTGVNFNAAISAQAYIFANNIQVFKGTFRILEVIIDNGTIEYEAVVFGELGGFLAKLGNKKLEDLDFSTYDHTYSIANITGSWTNAAGGSGYYYPLIDYGNYSTAKKDYKVGTFRPALFAKEYIDKIFAATGYTYDCDLFGTTRFESLIIPNNKKELTRKSALQLDISAEDYDFELYAAYITNFNIPLPIQTVIGNFTPNGTNQTFTYTGATVTGQVVWYHNFTWVNASNENVRIQLLKNGTLISTFSYFDIFSGDSDTYENTLYFDNVTINNGDVLTLNAVVNPMVVGLFSATVNSTRITFGNTGQQFVPIAIGEPVVINDIIPQNILQKDFVSSIVKLFNLYIFEDPNSLDKVLKIEPFIDFYADAESEDWSLKIDRSQPISIRPMSELNSRYYDFKFKKDSDYYNDLYSKRYNEEYGTYKYDSQYEFANETSTVELIFSGTPLLGYAGEDKVVSTIFKRTGDVTGQGEEQTDSNIRLLQAKLITGVSTWKIRNAANNADLHSDTSYPYAGHLDDPDLPTNDIQFGVPKELFFTLVTGELNNNQFNIYWSPYMAEITDKDSKLLTATAKLNYSDIYNLDFSKLKWIDGSLFRLNKIIDFDVTNESTCKVELLKVINKIY
jgi:hypothetical protein